MPPVSANALLLIEFLNTVDVETHTDLLDSPSGFRGWARSHGLRAGDRQEARRVRDALRAAAGGRPTTSVGVRLPIRLDDREGPRLAPADVAETALATAVELTAVGLWERVKLCPADDCLEAFYDTTRNRSRVWCDMADCGNLAKVRNYRRRASGQPD